MAGQTLSGIDNALKHKYLPPLQIAIPEAVELYNEFKKETTKWSGNQIVESINVSGNIGVRAGGATPTMPVAGKQGYQQHLVLNKNIYGRIQVEGQAIRASATADGAFGTAMELETKGLSRNMSQDIDRQMWTDGSGKLCLIKTGATSGTQTVQYAGSAATPVSGENGTRFLDTDLVLNIGTAAEHLAGTADNVTVTAITDRNVFTCGSFTSVAADIVTKAGAAAYVSDAYLNEIQGIDSPFITSGSYQNISVTDYPKAWKPNISSNSGVNRTLDETLIQGVIDDNYERGGGKSDLMLAQVTMRPACAAIALGDKRYLSGKNISLGVSGKIFFGETEMKFLRQCQYNRIYVLDRSTWTLYVQGGLKWADEDGKILAKITGYDAYEALLIFPANVGCNRPAANGVAKDISVTLPLS